MNVSLYFPADMAAPRDRIADSVRSFLGASGEVLGSTESLDFRIAPGPGAPGLPAIRDQLLQAGCPPETIVMVDGDMRLLIEWT